MAKYLKINLEKLQIKTKIGVPAEERKKPQIIEVTISILQQQFPKSITQYKTNDYVCYAELADIISKHCANKEFLLLESFCYFIYEKLKQNLPKKSKLKLEVKKLKPQMSYKAEAASCEIADE